MTHLLVHFPKEKKYSVQPDPKQTIKLHSKRLFNFLKLINAFF